MLNYFKAFSFFLLWSAIALSGHYYLSHVTFKNCSSVLNISNSKTVQNKNLVVINEHKDTLFVFATNFSIKKNNPKILNFKIVGISDSIVNYLKNNYAIHLQVIGNFAEEETASLGLQRANYVKTAFIEEGIKASKIITSIKKSNISFYDTIAFVNGFQLKFTTAPKTYIDSLENEISSKTLYLKFQNNQLLSSNVLDKYSALLFQYLTKYPSKKITIIGHTNSKGYFDKNVIKGLQRANLVKEYLIKKGINHTRIITFSKGESEPIAPKNTVKGSALNNRIEIQIKDL